MVPVTNRLHVFRVTGALVDKVKPFATSTDWPLPVALMIKLPGAFAKTLFNCKMPVVAPLVPSPKLIELIPAGDWATVILPPFVDSVALTVGLVPSTSN